MSMSIKIYPLDGAVRYTVCWTIRRRLFGLPETPASTFVANAPAVSLALMVFPTLYSQLEPAVLDAMATDCANWPECNRQAAMHLRWIESHPEWQGNYRVLLDYSVYEESFQVLLEMPPLPEAALAALEPMAGKPTPTIATAPPRRRLILRSPKGRIL